MTREEYEERRRRLDEEPLRLYWLFVRPGSGLIRWIWLAAIKRRAETRG